MFHIKKYLPYRTIAIVLVTAALLHYTGTITIHRALIVSLLSLLVVATGVIAGFIMIIPNLNCLLMRDHRVVEQPYTSETLTQRMTHEAVDFIERYMAALLIHTGQKTSLAFIMVLCYGQNLIYFTLCNAVLNIAL